MVNSYIILHFLGKMKNLLEFINYFGISVNETTPDIVIFAGYYLILSVFILLNVFNISMYLLSIYILSHEKILYKIPEKYGFILKFITFYKNIRIGFIIFELFLLLTGLLIMISVSYGIVSFYLNLK